MSQSTKELAHKYYEFTKESFDWCKRESETATSRVSEILDILVEDADRISQMSEDTLGALSTMREIIHSLTSGSRDTKKANNLSLALNELSGENLEVRQMLQPILEALQFQDRITQNMDNLSQMVELYLREREKIQTEGPLPSSELSRFAGELLKVTTMAQERDVIRQHIDGLEKENDNGKVLFF